MLPYISAVSPDGGLHLPALQPAALPQASHETPWAPAEANDGQRPQAQHTEAMPGQPNGQQVNSLNLCGIAAQVLLFCEQLLILHCQVLHKAYVWSSVVHQPEGSGLCCFVRYAVSRALCVVQTISMDDILGV